MTAERRAGAIEAVALVSLLAFGAFIEHREHGLERLWLAFGVALLGPIFRAVLVARGRLARTPWPLVTFELASFVGLAAYPVGRASHALVALAGLASLHPRLAPRPIEPARASLLEQAFLALLALATPVTALVFAGPGLETLLALAPLAGLGLGVALSPKEPGFEDAARLASGLALALAFAASLGYERVEETPRAADLLFLGAALVALVTATRALAGFAPSPRPSPRSRLATGLATAAVVAAVLAPSFDEVHVFADSWSYVAHHPTRTALYPSFIDLLDRAPERGLAGLTDDEAPPAAARRFVNVVRAQKCLAIVALATLAWSLSGTLAPSSVLALLALGLVDEAVRGRERPLASIGQNLDALLSEGLNLPLLFLAFAALVAAARSLRKPLLATLGLLLALLLLDRPANLAFAGVAVVFILAIPLLHGEGWRRAAIAAGTVALVLALPVLAACARNQARHGRFKAHSFTGHNVICVALQNAEVEDAQAFDDPEAQRFLRACLVDRAGLRRREWPTTPAAINANLWQIAMPAFAEVCPGKDDWAADELFSRVGWRLIALRPWPYARLVLLHLGIAWRWKADGLALGTAAFALLLALRSRRGELLLVAFWAAIPTIAILPACAFNYPLERYRCQLAFAGVLAAPLLVAVVGALGRSVVEREPAP